MPTPGAALRVAAGGVFGSGRSAVVAAAVSTVAAYWAFEVGLEDAHPDAAIPVMTGLVGMALLVSGGLLWSRAVAHRSGRLGWLSAGYLTGAVLSLVRIIVNPGAGSGEGYWRTSATGAAAASILASVALVTGPALAVAWPGARARAQLIAAALLAFAGVYADVVERGVPTLIAADGTPTGLATAVDWVVAVLAVLAAAGLWGTVSRAPEWTVTWPARHLVLLVPALGLRAISDQVYDAAWWASLSLQLLASAVLLGGLLAGFLRQLLTVERFAEQFAQGLETEARRASVVDLRPSPAEGDPTQDARGRARPTTGLDELLHGRDLTVVLQPVIDLTTGHTAGVEALSRFASTPPTPPSVVFRAAVEAGISLDIELLAVRRALEHLQAIPAAPWLALNVSPATAVSPQLAGLLRSQPSERIVLELTEHLAVEEYDALLAALVRLRADGVRVAVDDAGAGFASFRHVVRLRPDLVKLDMSLISGIDSDPVRRALVSSLLQFSRSIGASVIAEGIETRGEYDVLADLGVPYGQGYLLGRPRPAHETFPAEANRGTL